MLLSRKGPELTFTELGSSGAATGLQTTQRFHGTALSGVLVDAQAQWLYLLQAAPQVSVHKFQLAGSDVLPLSNVTLRTATSDKVLNVWNAVAWESRAALLAMSPSASGFNTSVVMVDPESGVVSEQLDVHGAPIRGIHAFDKRRERYFFVVSRAGERDLFMFLAATGESKVWSLGASDADLVGLHFDAGQCRLLGVYLRAPGVLSVC